MENDISKYRNQFDRDQYARLAGIELTEASPGYAKARMTIEEKHMNSVNVLHGGAIFTLADFAFAVASNSHGRLALAINAEISFFKAINNGTITATAKEISLHSKLATYLIDITDDNGEMVAHFKGTVYRKSELLLFD